MDYLILKELIRTVVLTLQLYTFFAVQIVNDNVYSDFGFTTGDHQKLCKETLEKT